MDIFFVILPLIFAIGIWALMFYIFYRVIKAAVKSALLEVKMEEQRMAGGYGQSNPYSNPGFGQVPNPGYGQNPRPGYGQAPEQEFQPERMGDPPLNR